VIKRSTATISEPLQSVSSAMYAAYPTADASRVLQSLPTGPHPVSQSKPDALSSSMKLQDVLLQSVRIGLHRRKLSFITRSKISCSASESSRLSGS
jgi:hypothetical protein